MEWQINLPCRIAGAAITTKDEAQQAWATQLKNPVHGRELTLGEVDKFSHHWLQNSTEFSRACT